MNDKILKENNFKVGADFELHTVKKKDISGKKECFLGEQKSEGEVYACKKRHQEKGGEEGEYLHAFQFMNIGFYLVTPLLVGVIFGSYLDSLLHIKPVGMLAGLSIGTVALFYNLYQLIKKTTYAGDKH